MGLGPSAAKAQSFGKYSLVAKLATGGMAEIFLARLQGSAGFEKLVCIKRILPHLARDQQLVDMFLAEAKIAAQISHPNVCSVFELGDIDGRYFIAMEYLEGVPFSCFRRPDMYAGTLDPRLVAGLGLQAAEGLHHAHQLKRPDGAMLEVIHRDVSANNLFATVDGVVKVLDFGIAKVQDASVRTSTGSVKGTYAYMAPEQLRGERLDRRTDVFALGIVLWELFSRKHLFKRETDFLTFQAITTDPIPDVSEFRPDVPPELAAVIAKALSRDRDDRYPTARAMGEALAHSVVAIGGPLSASAISDEITSAFEGRLADQRSLIRIAREGGALDLDDDLGPSVGHGTAMLTTPVSIVSGRGAGRASTVHDPEPAGAAVSVPSHASGPPRSVTMPVAPLPETPRSRKAIALVAIGAIGVGGVALFFALRSQKTTNDEPAIVMTQVMAPIDAPVIAIAPVAPPDAAAAPVPIDAAVATAPRHADVPTRPDRPPPKAVPAVIKPTGPPGFITIDSSPVYAVIYIDGKKYGETPLVHIELAPGKHSLRAVAPSGTSRTIGITIESGKVAPTRRIEW
jgi:serine/threonine protein kinase